MLGLLPDGSREVLTVVNHPTEGAIAWEMELEVFKERGVEQIDLIVSDALSGIENAVCAAFPTALHHLCVVHFKHKVLNTVSTKDKAEIGEVLKGLFSQAWGTPSLRGRREENITHLFGHYRFHESLDNLTPRDVYLGQGGN